MPSRKIKQVDGIGRKELSSAVEEFLRHCKLKNLAKATMAYYTEDLTYFQRCVLLPSRQKAVRRIPSICVFVRIFIKSPPATQVQKQD